MAERNILDSGIFTDNDLIVSKSTDVNRFFEKSENNEKLKFNEYKKRIREEKQKKLEEKEAAPQSNFVDFKEISNNSFDASSNSLQSNISKLTTNKNILDSHIFDSFDTNNKLDVVYNNEIEITAKDIGTEVAAPIILDEKILKNYSKRKNKILALYKKEYFSNELSKRNLSTLSDKDLINLMDNSMLRFIRRKIRSSFKNYYLSIFLDYRMKKTTYSDLNKNYRIGPIYILWIID